MISARYAALVLAGALAVSASHAQTPDALRREGNVPDLAEATAAPTAALPLVGAGLAPREIPYQGVLTQSGAPVTTSTSVAFSLYETASGGSAVWSETQTVTPDAGGGFAVRLGTVTALNVGIGGALWLQVSAGGTALGPRTPLGSVPYALSLYGVRVTPNSNASLAPSIAAGHPSNVASGDESTVSGGNTNTASGGRSTVGGGTSNVASAADATVAGGILNVASGGGAAVGGGRQHVASGNRGTIGGGFGNRASGDYSTVPGGYQNQTRGNDSFAAGVQARAIHNGTFVWADGSSITDSLVSTGSNQFLVRAIGGVGLGTNAPLARMHLRNEAQALKGTALESDDIVVEALDAVVGLYSPSAGLWGSALALGEVTATGTLANKWSIARRTGGTGGLYFSFGTDSNYATNDAQMVIETGGNVRADGSFIGGGADLAEFFPLAPGAAAPVPGSVVGMTAGRVSVETAGAEQLMVVSSDPAFVGNPAAEAGGVLVALVGQAEVRVTGPAVSGDVLIASGASDGAARAVSPGAYAPARDGAVLGRVLSAADGRVVALVGVDEASALRAVIARQQDEIDRQREALDALTARFEALDARLTLLP